MSDADDDLNALVGDDPPPPGLLPEGEYVLWAERGEPRAGNGTGTPGLAVLYRVRGGPHHGRPVWHTYWVTRKTVRFVRPALRILGITDTNLVRRPWPGGVAVRARVIQKENGRGEVENLVFLVGRLDGPPAL